MLKMQGSRCATSVWVAVTIMVGSVLIGTSFGTGFAWAGPPKLTEVEITSIYESLETEVRAMEDLGKRIPNMSKDDLIKRSEKLGEKFSIQLMALQKLEVTPMDEAEKLAKLELLSKEIHGTVALAFILAGKWSGKNKPVLYRRGAQGVLLALPLAYWSYWLGSKALWTEGPRGYEMGSVFVGVVALIVGGSGLGMISEKTLMESSNILSALVRPVQNRLIANQVLRTFFRPLSRLDSSQVGEFTLPTFRKQKWLADTLAKVQRKVECTRMLAETESYRDAQLRALPAVSAVESAAVSVGLKIKE